ncbi:MAG: xanthine dehydrogenase family protein molybdopterin-binding subunit, partial [Deltaproteobacteria bacterium]|nr:xanthine dehydrogenase family protein molybdopterin-binding subunit [Deltaproteobacteria bacterium]
MKEDRYRDLDLSHRASPPPVNRREFLKRLGLLSGGVIIYFSLGDSPAWAKQETFDFLFFKERPDFNAFLRIGADGRISCFVGKIEMGQGIIISMAQMLADELDAPLDSIDMLMGDTDLCPWDLGTFASTTTRFFGPLLRSAAAEAKAVLKVLAAEYLKIPLNRLKAKDGVIFDKTQTMNRVTYAQLAKGKRIERYLKKKPTLKAVSEFTLMGKSFPRQDALEKVTGKAKYAGDIRLPGMVYARILRPPVHGAKLMSVDTSAAKKVRDVQIVQDGDLIAVLHKYPDEAEKALTNIKAQFDVPEAKTDDKTIFKHLLNVAPKGNTVAQGGALTAGKFLAAEIIEETYLNSYVAHAPIETHTAVAKIEGDKATVWASTQAPFIARMQMAQALGFSDQNVRVITPFVGGGFGGKSLKRQAADLARLAKLVGKPVQIAWSREEEFFHDTFRPAALVKIKSGVNGSGKIVLWDYHVYFAGERGSDQFYEVPHHRTLASGDAESMQAIPGAHPFNTGTLRGTANSTNTFARESHIDIMASKAGIDPLEFRLNNLSDNRMRRVLKAAAKKFSWSLSKTPNGRGFGVACGIHMGTYLATMAEVEVDKKSGRVQV